MKYFTLLLLLAVPALPINGSDQTLEIAPSDPICRDNPILKTRMEYEDYRIQISSAGDQSCESLDVIKGDTLVYHDEEIGGHFYFGDRLAEESEPFLELPDREYSNLVVSKWTGGAHCCYSLHIFELGESIKSVARIDGGNFLPTLEDINEDGLPEIKTTDDFLAYQFSSFASSGTADVVLEYSKGTFKVAADFMKKPAPDSRSLEKEIRSWRSGFRETSAGDYPPPPFIQYITDLFFTGNRELALDVIDRAWPTDIPGKTDFIESYGNALHESRFYEEFESQVAN